MYSIFYYIFIYIFLGAMGMSVANRKVTPAIKRRRWIKYFSYILITGIVITSIFLGLFRFLSLVIAVAGLVELSSANFRNSQMLSIISIIIYLAVGTGFILFSFQFSQEAILFIYFQVLIFDAFGQITGQLIGKTLLSRISPTKTVEGLVGAWLFCIASGLLAANWVGLSAMNAALFGVFTGLTSFSGDMLASWFKRVKEIKDYSNSLPGQGGFLDRFDSLIFTGGVYFLISMLFKESFIIK